MGEKPLVGRAYGSPMRGRGARREERSVQTQTQLLNSNLHLVAKHRSCYLIKAPPARPYDSSGNATGQATHARRDAVQPQSASTAAQATERHEPQQVSRQGTAQREVVIAPRNTTTACKGSSAYTPLWLVKDRRQ